MKACGQNIIKSTLILLGLFFSLSSWAFDEEYAHPGYLDDVRDEKNQVTREVVIVPPMEPDATRLVDRIFTEKLTKDFSKEFRDRFGYTEFEQIGVTSNRFVGDGSMERLVPVDEYIDQQESFGQYMAKELAEYHIDSYLKGNRNTRTVYKAKQAISNVEVQSAGGYKFKFRYKIASNKMSFKFERPREKFHQQLDIKGDGRNPTVRLGYDVNKTVRLGSDYTIDDEILSLRGEKRLTPTLVTSITGQSYQKAIGDRPAQERVLLGLSWND
jgi:hypothetical protein